MTMLTSDLIQAKTRLYIICWDCGIIIGDVTICEALLSPPTACK